jgi:hypothetical protein
MSAAARFTDDVVDGQVSRDWQLAPSQSFCGKGSEGADQKRVGPAEVSPTLDRGRRHPL